MKKIYSIMMAFMAVIGCSMSASATDLIYTLDPADGSTVTEISSISFNFPETADMAADDGYTGIDLYEYNYNSPRIYLMQDTVTVATAESCDLSDVDDAIMIAVFNPAVTTPGKYTLYVPAREFCSYADYTYVSHAIYATYTIVASSGIESVEAEGAVVKGIYNLQGMRVNGDRNSLAPGIYVIDGKKVAVK